MKLANLVVGNDENESVFEITLVGPSLKISEGTLIAISGADISPEIDGKRVPADRPVYIKKDCILDFGRCILGSRCYLAVAGGFDVPDVMGSRSTYTRGKIGGKDGRCLLEGDVVKTRSKSEFSRRIIKSIISNENFQNKKFLTSSWYVRNYVIESIKCHTIRVFKDTQFNMVKADSIKDFFNSCFTIDAKSDRMGFRLKGPKIEFQKDVEMISGEVSFGTIQIPGEGNPIILLADRTTAGGYPKIAHVAACDIPKLVQLKPMDKIKFHKIELKEAEKLYIERRSYTEDLKKSIRLMVPDEFF